ncbi:hypothetical protein B0H66DRAFT_43441 [Apodospora peruviana]|uniref:Zonadhesin n=1 Tax=Apodospora peruviana TaxID=516989 RepID=A0AAE0MF78_9PEZI|nr:hypothetical protein B0H66DRAFT_43441 [Apodospora peruviana]
MQQPLIPSGTERTTYEYSIQATEDHEEFREDVASGKKPPIIRRPGQAPNYKPTPLTWPFIAGMVVMLCVAIALVSYAEKSMPGSDSDAVIVDSPSPARPRRFARQGRTNSSTIELLVESSQSTPTVVTVSSSGENDGSVDPVVKQDQPSSVSKNAESTPTSSGSEIASDLPSASQAAIPSASSSPSQTPSPISSSETLESPDALSTPSQSVSGGYGDSHRGGADTAGQSDMETQEIGAPSSILSDGEWIYGRPATSISKFTSWVSIPEETLTFETTLTSVMNITTTKEVVTVITSVVSQETVITTTSNANFLNGTGSLPPSFESGVITITEPVGTVEIPVTTNEPVTEQTTKTIVSSFTSTQPATFAPSVGEVTVTYFNTIQRQPNNNGPFTNNQILTPVDHTTEAPVVKTGVVVIDGTTNTVVETQAPVVVVVPTNEVKTEIFNRPAVTGVTQVGGSEFTSILILTPTPINREISVNIASTVGGTLVTVVNQPDAQTITTMIGGVLQTVVETPPPQTVVSMAGGVLTTVGVVMTPGTPGQPITYTGVSDVAGTPVTQLLVTTPPAGPAFQPISYTITTNVDGTPTVVTITPVPTSFVTTIDGTPVTMFTTPPVTSFTTTAGGTLTTETLVTTPTGTGLITITFVSSSGGVLSTYTSTFAPSTFLSTISGKLTTITSTPSPTTRFSTRSKSTSTFTSTSSSTSAPTSAPEGPPIGSTRVFKWTEADIFVGTFLPPLLGVALIIPLRIIDLNAKLYQPFQSLAQPGGGSGRETLTMQYTGFMTFVTPFVTLLQGHPVPFLTTLMVGCASFMVPLATEAIGLKLHGKCQQNTASPECGPSLGVSPVPANALIGLIVVVIILLLLVLFFIRRWATGVHANPWNIAGIASLAGNSQVRIRQNSEAAMKRVVSQKQYGLGYFQNAMGQEEYGIVLTDESGRGLQDLQPGDSDSDGLIEPSAAANRRSASPNNLPFMPLRYPWRIALIAFQLGLLIFIIYYHVYYHVTLSYRGKVYDNGRLWEFMNSNTFGVRFVAAIVGVIIAFCWQSFFLSVSFMTPYQLMSLRTQPAERSILFSSSTNAFSGIWAAVKQGHVFLFATSLAAILSEFLPVFLSNIFFNLAQTSSAATACTVISAVTLGLLIIVLVWSFFVRWPPMPVDPRSIAGTLYYVSQSHMLEDMDGVSTLGGRARAHRIKEMGRRYFYGVLVGGSWRRLGVDCDLGPSENVDTAYHSTTGLSRVDEAPVLHEHDEGAMMRHGLVQGYGSSGSSGSGR